MTNHADTSDKTYKYEVGFLLIPTLSEDQVNSTVEGIRKAITSRGGAVSAEGAPQMRPLAYEMTKGTVGKKHKYKTAHFGWIQCTLASAEALPFRADLEKNTDILRFLFIRKDRETVLLTPQDVESEGGEKVESPAEETEASADAKVSSATPEELDKKIDNLVVS